MPRIFVMLAIKWAVILLIQRAARKAMQNAD